VSEPANAQRIRRLFDAFRRADLDAIEAVIAVDAVWHFPGRSGRLAGAHRGRAAILAFLVQVQALSGGSFHLDLEVMLADDAHAVACFRGHGARDGKTLDNPTCLRLRLVAGQVVEVWEYVWDLYAVDEFWA